MAESVSQPKVSNSPQNNRDALWVIIETTTIAHATDLARAGHYTEAEAALKDVIREREATPAILDLLARIYAQQGHWKEAEAAWKQALQMEPENESYTAGLKRVAQMAHRPFFPPLILLIITVLVIVLGSLAGGRYIFFPTHPTATVTPSQTLIPSLTQTPAWTQTPFPTQIPSLTETRFPSPSQVISLTSTILTCRVIPGISNGALNVRKGPDIYFPLIGRLQEGDQVVILGNPDIQVITGWLFIFREPDLQGWINSSYCK